MPLLHGKPRFLLHLHRSVTQPACARVRFPHLSPQPSPLQQTGSPFDAKLAVVHGYAVYRRLLPCRSFSSAHAATVDPHPAAEEAQDMVMESSSTSVTSDTQALEENRDCGVDGTLVSERKAGALAQGSVSAQIVVEIDTDTAVPDEGTEVDSTGQAAPAVPIDSIHASEEGDRVPDPLKQLEAEEVNVLLEHGIKTPALELHCNDAAADNLAQPSLMLRSINGDMTIKDLLEEQRKYLCKMQRQLEEQNSLMRSIFEDVGILKSMASSRALKQAETSGYPLSLPSWPEWVAFTQHLKSLGYFKVDEESVNTDVDILTDPARVRRAMLKFSLAYQDTYKDLENEHLEVLAKSNYGISTKKNVFAQRRLQRYLGLKVSGFDGEAIEAKHVGGQFGLLDVMRLIYGTAVCAASQMSSPPDNVKSSIVHLLPKIVALTARPSDGEPVSKKAQEKNFKVVDNGKHQQTVTRIKVQSQEDVAQPNTWKCPRCSHVNGLDKQKCVECSHRQPAQVDAQANSGSSDEDLESLLRVPGKEGARKARGKARALVQDNDTGSDGEVISESDFDDIIVESVEDSEDIHDNANTRATSKRGSLSNLVKEHPKSFSHDRGRSGRPRGREKPKLMGRSSLREIEESDSDRDDFRSHSLSREFFGSSRTVSRAKVGQYDNVRGETFSRRSHYDQDEDNGSGRVSSRAVGGRGRSRF